MKFDLSRYQHWGLLIIFIAISYGASILLGKIPINSVFIEIPGFFGIFSSLLFGFDKWAWKWKIFRITGVIDFPNLNGIYTGSFTSSYKNPETGESYRGDMRLTIKQTASEIIVHAEFNKSKSISTQSSFGFNDIEQEVCLYYFFKNKPEKGATKTMHAHEGSCILKFDEKTNELNGEYYSGRDRNNYGDIHLKKIQ